MGRSKEKSLYEVLGIEKTSTQPEIKRAYLKLAVKLHPDKNPGDEEAKGKFQSLQRIYSVLGDEEKRKIYDQTGSLEDSEEISEDFSNLYQYFKNIAKKVTEEDIDQYSAEYRGSEEEKQDVKKYYNRFNGVMEMVFDHVICSDPKRDSHRYADIIEAAAAEGEIKLYSHFETWAKNVRKKPKPSNPLAKPKPKAKGGQKDDSHLALAASIRANAQKRMGSILQKYGGSGDEPSEEEFAQAAARLNKKKKTGSAAQSSASENGSRASKAAGKGKKRKPESGSS